VNLRCCQVTKGKINLYVGGGYTKDSNPEMEWQETENKSRTILNLVEKL
jgi:isochorismate synthase